jgi:ATP-dependent Clp protease ATP-binding subunit ClpC
VVFLELSRIGDPRARTRSRARTTGLLAELARAYATRGRGELEAYAGLPRGASAEGVISMRAHGTLDGMGDEGDADAFAQTFDRLLDDNPQLLVLQLVGPSVREFFAGESGCQVLETLGGEHQIVRVRVLDGDPSDDPAALIARTLRQRQAFAEALEAGTSLPRNPDRMLPILRLFKLEEPRPGRTASVEVEDYPLSHASTHTGDRLEPVLELLWLMRVGLALHEDRERRNTESGLGGRNGESSLGIETGSEGPGGRGDKP